MSSPLMRSTSLLLAGLLLAVAGTGCLAGPENGQIEAQDGDKEATTVELGLDEIPEDSDWVLAKLHLKEPTNVTGDLHTDVKHPGIVEEPQHARDPGMPCFVAQVGFSTVTLPTPYHEFGARVGIEGDEAGASTAWPFGEGTQAGTWMLKWDRPAGPVPVLLGMDDPESWEDRVELSLEVNATGIEAFEVVDHGDLWCATGPEEFQEGTYVEAHASQLSPAKAEGLASTHHLENRGAGFAFLQANLDYHIQVLEDGEVRWEEEGEPRGSFDVVNETLNLSSGEVEVRVPYFSATDSLAVGYLLLDLPAWAAEPFQEGAMNIW